MGLFRASLRGVVALLALCAFQLVFGAAPAHAQTFVCTVTATDYASLSIANTGAGQSIFLFNSDGIYNWSNTNGSAGATCANNPGGANFGEDGEQLRVWNGSVYAQGALSPGTDFTTVQGGTIRATRGVGAPFDTIAYTPPSPSFTGTDTFYLTDGDNNGLRMVITVTGPPTPTVTSVSPAAGASGTTTPNVIVTGTGLLGATAVTFGGTTAGFVVDSATQITATAPSRSAGAVNVVVTRGSASATSAANVFTYFNAPTVTAAFSPSTIATAETSTLTLTLNNPNAGQALTGVAVAAAALPANLAGSGASTSCSGGTVTYNAGTRALSLSGAALAASASCTVTLGVSSSTAASYNYTTGAVSASGPGPATGSTATTPTALTITALPTVSVAVAPASVSEDGATNLTYTVTRSAASTSALTVNLTTTGTATSGSDYTGASATATIAANATTTTVVIDPTVDALNEPDETVILTVATGSGYTVGAPAAATGTLLNDDAQPSLSINDATLTEGNAGTTVAAFTVTLSAASAQTVTVDYATANGTAQAPGDYIAASGTLTFSPGETTQPVLVTVNGDTVVETDEGFNVGLSGAVNASIADNSGAGAITNDDLPSASIALSPASVAEDGAPNLIYTVTLHQAPAVATTVNFTVGGTATEGGDYAVIGTTVGFAIGQTTGTVVVDPSADATIETDETVILTLAAGTGYSVGSPSTRTGTIANDDTPDTTPPPAPVIVTPANGSVTADSTPDISGTAEPHSTVAVEIDTVAIGSATANGAGNWTLTASALADGPRAVVARATDAASNTSPASVTTTFTVDTAPPAAPVVTAPVAGSSIASSTPTISGMAEAGSTVTVLIDGAAIGTAVANGSGAWSLAAPTLADGARTASARATDAAGNTGATSTSFAFTVDAAPPPAPVIVTPANGSITADSTPDISGTTEPLSTVVVEIDTVAIGSVVANGSGAWILTAPTLADGPRAIVARATDAASNTSPASATSTVTIDATPPAAPVILAPVAGSSIASSTPTISGTAEAGSTVTVLIDGAAIGTAVANGSGVWSLAAPTLADGARTASARATDAAGGTGSTSTPVAFTIDTATPPAPVIVSPADGDDTTATPTISGTAEAGATVLVTLDGGVTSVTANGSGAWSFAPGTVSIAAHAVSARTRDAAGNTSAASAVTTFTARASSVSGLTNLSLSAGALSPAFSTGGLGYTASVGFAATAVTVTPTAVDPASVVRVNGVVVASGAASGAIALAVGTTTIAVVVTAADGVATTSYSVQVTRGPSNVSSLSGLAVSSAVLSPAFSPGTTSYAATVANAISAVTVSPTATDGSAAITVNGVPVASGGTSGPISLAVGANTVSTVVTAPDGVNTTTYAIALTRAEDAPVAGPVSLGVAYNAAATGVPLVLGGGPTTSIAIASPPANGAVVVSGATATYQPGAGFSGTDSFTYVATGPGGVSAPATVSVTVATPAVIVSPGPFVAGRLGLSYSETVTASGGQEPYRYAVTSGALPAGLTLSMTGTLSGTPSTTGVFDLSITATDSSTGAGPFTGVQAFSLTIQEPVVMPPIGAASSLTVAHNAAATAVPLALTGGAVASLAVTTAPTLGTVTIAGSTIAYMPTSGAYGVDSFVYTATGPGGVSAPATVTVTITSPTLTLGPASLPAGQEDVAYSTTLTVSGGTGPYTLTATEGTLPAGLSLSGAGVLSGTPTASGSYGFTVTATDASTGAGPARVSQAFALSITAPPPPVIRPLPGAIPNIPGQPTRIDLSALIAGDFDEIRIADPPLHGTITLEIAGASAALSAKPVAAGSLNPRTVAVYSAAPGYVGADSFAFVAIGPGGTSTPMRLSITVAGLPPSIANLTANIEQGRPVTVDLTGAASPAPFTAAAIVSITPAGSAGAALVEGGVPAARTYGLTITPRSDFEGTVVVRYTISNSAGVSPPATVTVTVRPRPDPSNDPTVRALATAQAQASRLFAATQLGNFNRRNEGLRGPGEGRDQGLGLSLSSGFAGLNADPLDTLPWADRERRLEAERDLSPSATAGRSDPFRGAGGRSGAPPAFEGEALARSGDAGPRAIGSVSVWSGGAITVGGFDQTRRTASFDITTSGVSAGADVKLGDRLTIGAGGGFGTQHTDIGEDDEARLEGQSWTAALYGSWRPSSQTFIDGVVGYGELDFDTRRLAADGGITFGQRNGDALMASLTSGWQRSSPQSTLSAYGRFDHVSVHLDAYSETGAGLYDLAFAERDLDSLVGALGVRGQRISLLRGGVLTRSARMEWRHEFSDLDGQRLDYADLSGFRYGVDGETWMRNEIAAELGVEVTYDTGLTLGADIGASFAEGGETATLRLLLAKRF